MPKREVSTPFPKEIEGGEPLDAAHTAIYRTGAGAIGWMCAGRIDLIHAYSRLGQHLQTPTTSALQALVHAYAYLAWHPDLCLGQSLDAEPVWQFFTDADYGGNTEVGNRGRPQLGALALCGGTPVLFTSKVAKVAFAHPNMRSAHAEVGVAGAEIYALGNGVADFIGLTYTIRELGLPPVPLPFIVEVDNSTAEVFAKKSVTRTKLRHIDQRQWWVRACQDQQLCKVDHVDTKDNLSDFFTKRHGPAEFIRLRDRLMVRPPAGALGDLTHFGS